LQYEASGNEILDHFADIGKMVEIDSASNEFDYIKSTQWRSEILNIFLCVKNFLFVRFLFYKNLTISK